MKVTEKTKLFARKALKYIEQHPEQHNQQTWIRGDKPGHCGTTMCVAGTVNFLKNGLDAIHKGSHSEGRLALGLSSGEAEVLFYEMDEERAVNKLRKVASGEQFTEEDFCRAGESGSEPVFDSYAWDDREVYL